MRVGNSSARNAPCGPFIAECTVTPTIMASVMRAGERVCSRGKNRKPQTIRPAAPKP